MEELDHAENTAQIQRGRPFERGKSGNPAGRPKGARNYATVLAEGLLDGEVEAITRKVIDKALEGDSRALRLCLERLLSPRRERPVAFQLPAKIETLADVVAASSSVLGACAAGDLTPGDAVEIMNMISTHTRLVDRLGERALIMSMRQLRYR